ncbi:MAG: hypothetical protein ACHQ4G_09425 [Opitutales bacterium]
MATWRTFPWVAAAMVFSALVAVAHNETLWTQARSFFPWMLRPIFHDWRVVQLGWWQTAAGLDPLAAADSPYNYPRLLLAGAHLGLQHVPVEVFCLTAAALTLTALAFVLSRTDRITAVIGSLLLLSSPVLLLLERGNLDAWIVVLLVGGVYALTRESRPGLQAVGAAAVLLAAALKLYPALLLIGGMAVWRGNRRRWLALTLAGFVVMLVLNRADLGMIFKKTGRGLEASYGWAITGSRYFLDLRRAGEATERSDKSLAALMNASLGIYAALMTGSAVVGWTRRASFSDEGQDALSRVLFWTGALIYAGSFGLGANWSYRLVYLLFCIPWLGQAVRKPQIRIWAGMCLLLIGVTMLAPFQLTAGWFYLVQAGEWLLASLLFCGAVGVIFRDLGAEAVAGADKVTD